MSRPICQDPAAYFAAFLALPHMGPSRFEKLFSCFDGNPEVAWGSIGLAACEGVGIKGAEYEALAAVWERYDPVAEAVRIREAGIAMVTVLDDAYPALLKEIIRPPWVLFVRGVLPKPDMPLLGVVGTRKVSPYGLQVIPPLVKDICHRGIGIVSGLALGVDGIAHRAALDACGYTVGVLATGVDEASIYPRDHVRLSRDIIARGGCILSEFLPGTAPEKYYFPQRNRVISGMSLGVVVGEADERSGSLITAFCALEQNREVFAIPGPITNQLSRGPHMLLKKGAHLLASIDDIIECFPQYAGGVLSSAVVRGPLDEISKTIYDSLTEEPTHVNEIAVRTGFDMATVNATLTMMELDGWTKNVGSMRYLRVSGPL